MHSTVASRPCINNRNAEAAEAEAEAQAAAASLGGDGRKQTYGELFTYFPAR